MVEGQQRLTMIFSLPWKVKQEEGDSGAYEDEGQVALLGLIVATSALTLGAKYFSSLLSPHSS